MFKKLLKTITVIAITTIILFGVYRREYINQAIPVYLQYLKQKIKWQINSTGNYVYFFYDWHISENVFFVDYDKAIKVFRIGQDYRVKFIGGEDRVSEYEKIIFDGLSKKKDNYFLIDKRFDEISTILWKKLWDFNDYNRYRYEIGYDDKYGYPIVILVDRENNKHLFSLGEHFPSFNFFIYDLKMLPKNTMYSEKVLTKLLQWVEERDLHRRQKPTQENNSSKDESIVKEVGGDLIKGMVIKRY